MPCVYKRKQGAPLRGIWTEEASSEAIRRYKAGDIGLREAARYYGVPTRTLVRRIASGNNFKRGLGPEGVLHRAYEKLLVAHIQHLVTTGFSPVVQTVHRLAYQSAENLGFKFKFSHTTKKSTGLSLARAQSMSRSEVGAFFKILEQVMMEVNLMDNPQNIFNMDEIDQQTGKVLTTKGTKAVHGLTLREKGENITVIICCNVEEAFLTPEHLLPRESPGNNILILDGHGTQHRPFSHWSAHFWVRLRPITTTKLKCGCNSIRTDISPDIRLDISW
ncbi:hypothetical protein PR048_005647 [Dryococelus australis]|uniref:HTH psq-type domain-containing protein n=1 Tax=Dryococelus australis TaxID=614101 RepID=A0ABQ9I8U6_9NEOP|nr:hypothetical protein PR048_005647 [Dryococelus australis]